MASPKQINRLPSLGCEIATDWKSPATTSPTRPSQPSPSSLSSSSSPRSRFNFSNKLGGRFYQNNTIMNATKQTKRKHKQAVAKAAVWDAEMERLQVEIQEVLALEKQARAIKERKRQQKLKRRNAAASSIQRSYRLFRILHHRARRKKKAAVLTMRKMLSGSTGRAYAKDATDRVNAELLQAVLGGSLKGLDPIAYAKYKRDSYAKDLQTWWRHIMALKRSRAKRHTLSVLFLQRVYRGNLGRLKARKLAEIKARQNLMKMALSGIGRIAFDATRNKKKATAAENEKIKKEMESDEWLKNRKKRSSIRAISTNRSSFDTKKNQKGKRK